MRKVLKIDTNGYFVEDIILEDEEIAPEGCVEIECPPGFYRPKWNGTNWTEGATQEEIDNVEPQEPSELDKIKAENESMKQSIAELTVLVTSMMGGGV